MLHGMRDFILRCDVWGDKFVFRNINIIATFTNFMNTNNININTFRNKRAQFINYILKAITILG